ncbi:YjzD family protein [Jeotgalibacillus marinus]|uniref:YjzD family protein n=1 Tax=Jeotgalibacillus marinus TaxID=86667 RepID=A0ABV3Q307_9BACL
MAYIWTFFWTFLLIQMATYVVSSMNGVPYNFVTGTTIAVIATVAIFVIGAIIPKPQVEEQH